jgi:integrase/recombinase XerD
MISMSNQDLVTKFVAYLMTEKRVSANTRMAYQKDIDQFASFLTLHNCAMLGVTPALVQQFLISLYESGLTARSVSRKISAIKLLCAYLHRQFGVDNIGLQLRLPKTAKSLPKYLSIEEIEELIACADKDTSVYGVRNKAMLYLMYVTGMRVSELVHITLSDLQRESGFIVIQGKGDKQRMVPVPDSVFVLLYTYIEQVRPEIVGKSMCPYLFPIKRGALCKPISRQSVWAVLQDLWKQTGNARTISPHQLRHSLATHLLKKGANLRSLQMLLGHEKITTVQVYTHIETSYLRAVYDKKHPRA